MFLLLYVTRIGFRPEPMAQRMMLYHAVTNRIHPGKNYFLILAQNRGFNPILGLMRRGILSFFIQYYQ